MDLINYSIYEVGTNFHIREEQFDFYKLIGFNKLIDLKYERQTQFGASTRFYNKNPLTITTNNIIEGFSLQIDNMKPMIFYFTEQRNFLGKTLIIGHTKFRDYLSLKVTINYSVNMKPYYNFYYWNNILVPELLEIIKNYYIKNYNN